MKKTNDENAPSRNSMTQRLTYINSNMIGARDGDIFTETINVITKLFKIVFIVISAVLNETRKKKHLDQET